VAVPASKGNANALNAAEGNVGRVLVIGRSERAMDDRRRYRAGPGRLVVI